MTRRDEIVTPHGTHVDISMLETDTKQFVINLYQIATPEFSKTTYGHAALALASSVLGAANSGANKVEQTDYLRRSALETIEKFGAGIIPLLRDELKLALSDDDLRSLGL